jgi:opacity protein-like surface antigen
MSYADVISGNTENSFRISEELMSYNAAYNNTTPYGLATPNRRGVYFEALREDTALFRRSFIQVARLSQSRGTGTSEKMNFILAEAGTDVYLNDIIGWKKEIKIGLGVRYENSSRAGEEYETAKLNSTLIDLGLSVEFLTKLDLLLGAKLWNVSGNAFVNERNRYNTVENFDIVELDFVENTYAGGLRYRFNENNSVTAQYQLFEIAHADEQMADYGMSQFTFLLSLSF